MYLGALVQNKEESKRRGTWQLKPNSYYYELVVCDALWRTIWCQQIPFRSMRGIDKGGN